MNHNLSADSLHALRVRPEQSILEVMRVIDRAGLEVAMMCDTSGVLKAVITDGDIRRALIRGEGLDRPVGSIGNARFTSLGPAATRAEAARLMLERGIKSVPVVDDRGMLVDVHTLHLALQGGKIDSWAVVMAGGKGERLGELTKGIPKPMLPIGDRPILEHIVQHLVSHGIRRVFLSVGYLAGMIEDHFGDGSRFFCRIEYLREQEPLGTGGALTLLPEIPTAPLVVMNGDLLTRINVGRMIEFHRETGSQVTMALREHIVKVPFGVAEVAGERVSRLVEKPELSYLINAGIYVLDPSLLAAIPRRQPYPITRLIDHCLAAKLPVSAYPMQEVWADIGMPEEYHSVMSPDAGTAGSAGPP